MRKQLFALMFVVIILFGGLGAVKSGYRTSVSEANPTQSFTESFTVNEGSVETFGESNRDVVYNQSVTVEQNGTKYDSDGNYTWYENNGTLLVQSGSSLSDSQSANITYELNEPQNEQQVARDVGLVPTDVMGGWVVELVGLFMLLGAFVVLIRMGGR